MTVRPVPFEPGRYYAKSGTNPELDYLVDANHDGNMVCGCRGFEVRKHCHHVELVRMYQVIERITKRLIVEQTEQCQCAHCRTCRELLEDINRVME